MRSKPPSSLDYDGHLHELALRNWRRAIDDHDIPRAELNARTLTRSHDKFWRFVGGMHLALAHLSGGRTRLALDAFASAAGAYPESPRLVSVARAQIAHVHLETNAPTAALTALQDVSPTLEVRYWSAVARARLGDADEAREAAKAIDDPLLRAHVVAETGDEPKPLTDEAERVPSDALPSPRPAVPALIAAAARVERPHAIPLLTRVVDATEALAHWPIPYVRSLHRLGRLRASAGNDEAARALFRRYLRLWENGELDRDDVASASQSVKL